MTVRARAARSLLALPLIALVATGAAVPAQGASNASSNASSNAAAAAGGTTSAIGIDPSDTGSMSAVTRIVGAQDAWADGWTGEGIDVAVIDTGVARVPGLDGEDKVIDGPDLSFDAATGAPTGVDAFGHGTLMAGIIAGRDDGVTASAADCTSCLNDTGYSTTDAYVGVAPESRIVNVKVGAEDGATDVTQVIAAVNWVTQHAQDPGLNIRVLNLSYGTTSAQPYLIDPLAHAVEQAWKQGIVVVVSAGNEGKVAPELAAPAYDPYVLAVGGLDPLTKLGPSDDKIATFAVHGTAERPVDVVAPAVSVVGLRVPGSYADNLVTNHGQEGERFQRGSGTSEAAAVVSGVAALVLQRYPQATPDQVKALLMETAEPVTHGALVEDDPRTVLYSGSGTVDADAAIATALPDADAVRQTHPESTGTGSLDATRNGVFVTDDGVDLTGEQDVFGQAFDGAAMASLQRSATAWTGGIWNGSRWSGDDWDGRRWTGSRWSGSRWSGVAWDGSRWSDATWDGRRWTGSRWSGSRWSGSRWSGSRWSGSTWDGSRWSSSGWS